MPEVVRDTGRKLGLSMTFHGEPGGSTWFNHQQMGIAWDSITNGIVNQKDFEKGGCHFFFNQFDLYRE